MIEKYLHLAHMQFFEHLTNQRYTITNFFERMRLVSDTQRVNGETFDSKSEIVEVMEDRVELERIQTSTTEVRKLLEELDAWKSAGPDSISNWVLKECNHQPAEKLSNMIYASLEQGRVPTDWKRANVVQIYKGGVKEDPLNYRTVSLTSVVAKICEKM